MTKATAKDRNRAEVVSNKTVTINSRPTECEIRQTARFNSQQNVSRSKYEQDSLECPMPTVNKKTRIYSA